MQQWDITGNGINLTDDRITLKWDIFGNQDFISAYEYILSYGSGLDGDGDVQLVNMREFSEVEIDRDDFSNLRITTEILGCIIGENGNTGNCCNNYLASNFNSNAGVSPPLNNESFSEDCEYELSLLFASNEDLENGINVTPDDINFEFGLYLVNPEAIDIEAIQFSLNYDASAIAIDNIRFFDPALAQNYEIVDCGDNCAEGNYSFAMYYNGEGEIYNNSVNHLINPQQELFIIEATKSQTVAEGNTFVSFESLLINEVDLGSVNFNQAEITIIGANFSVEGSIKYYTTQIGVVDASVSLNGVSFNQDDETEADGSYEFPVVPKSNDSYNFHMISL